MIYNSLQRNCTGHHHKNKTSPQTLPSLCIHRAPVLKAGLAWKGETRLNFAQQSPKTVFAQSYEVWVLWFSGNVQMWKSVSYQKPPHWFTKKNHSTHLYSPINSGKDDAASPVEEIVTVGQQSATCQVQSVIFSAAKNDGAEPQCIQKKE